MGGVVFDFNPLLLIEQLFWDLSGHGKDYIWLKHWIAEQRMIKLREVYETEQMRQNYLYLLANGFI